MNASASPLLRLPPEIRSYIWELSVGQVIRPVIDIVVRQHLTEVCTKHPQVSHPNKHRFGLLRVSRQIYGEAALSVYTYSTFSFMCLNDIYHWLDHLRPHEAQLVTRIRHVLCGAMALALIFPRICDTYFPFTRFPALQTLKLWFCNNERGFALPEYLLAELREGVQEAFNKDGVEVEIVERIGSFVWECDWLALS